MRSVNLHFAVQNPKGSLKGLWKVSADERYHPMQMNGFLHHGLFLTYGGAGDIYLGNSNNPVPLCENSSFILPAHTRCHYHRHLYSPKWTFYFLEFTLPPVLIGEDLPFLKSLPLVERCRLLCEEFTDEIAWNRTGRDACLERGFLEIMNFLIRTETRETDGIEGVLKWMHGHPDLDFHVDELINRARCTRTVFFQRFRNRTGSTPQVYFRNLKIKAAQSLLETTDLKMSEIAERLNFCDEYYFSRQFKQLTGYSPLHWKRMQKQNMLVHNAVGIKRL